MESCPLIRVYFDSINDYLVLPKLSTYLSEYLNYSKYQKIENKVTQMKGDLVHTTNALLRRVHDDETFNMIQSWKYQTIKELDNHPKGTKILFH